MQLADSRLPVLYPRSSSLTFGTSSFIHVCPICSINISTNGTFSLVCILPMVSSRHSTMAAALLAVRVEVANFYGLIAAILPLNLYIGLVHIVLPSQLTLQQRGFSCKLKNAPASSSVKIFDSPRAAAICANIDSIRKP